MKLNVNYLRATETSEARPLDTLEESVVGIKTASSTGSGFIISSSGHRVYGLYNWSPLNTDLSGTVSQGIISSFRLMDDQEYIQSDALINGGNSGGPMIDEKRNVVAISVSSRTDGEGVKFFIPISFALRALNISLPGKTESKYVSED
jgi:S1-C subfamily serine protease